MAFRNKVPKPVEFKEDDEAYFAWLTHHPNGYVMNVRKELDPGYVVLHRASCGSISSRKVETGAYTSRGYRKWCSDQISDLRQVAKYEGRKDGTFSKCCRRCNPLAGEN